MHATGARHGRWNGGRSVRRYVRIRKPDHPRADKRGYVLEHVLVAEAALGRFLPKRHPVHHVDEIKTRNVTGNLVICENQAYHHLLHERTRALLACGDANAKRCSLCGSYDRQAEIVDYGHHNPAHRGCKNDYSRNWKRQRKETA